MPLLCNFWLCSFSNRISKERPNRTEDLVQTRGYQFIRSLAAFLDKFILPSNIYPTSVFGNLTSVPEILALAVEPTNRATSNARPQVTRLTQTPNNWAPALARLLKIQTFAKEEILSGRPKAIAPLLTGLKP